ncbi:MAG: hypothetical protein ABIH25_05655 [Candidatus Woesearchaeota archaeon]
MDQATKTEIRKLIREELKKIEKEKIVKEREEDKREDQEKLKEAKRLACKKCGGLNVISQRLAYLKANSGLPYCKCK